MKILLPINDWSLGKAQAESVAPYVRFPHTTILLVSVVEPMVAHTYRYGYGSFVADVNEEKRRRALRLLEKIQTKLCEFCPPDRIEARIVEGKPIPELLRLVSVEHVDLVIVAQRDKHALLKIFSRSVCDCLAGDASCSTLVVKPEVKLPIVLVSGIQACAHPGARTSACSPSRQAVDELAGADRR